MTKKAHFTFRLERVQHFWIVSFLGITFGSILYISFYVNRTSIKYNVRCFTLKYYLVCFYGYTRLDTYFMAPSAGRSVAIAFTPFRRISKIIGSLKVVLIISILQNSLYNIELYIEHSMVNFNNHPIC